MSRKCPDKKSLLHKESSMIFTTNSRAGCDMTCVPKPRPCHLPVHQALFVSSCLNSRVRNTAMRNLCTARWIEITATRPRTACEASQSSRNHYARRVRLDKEVSDRKFNVPKTRKSRPYLKYDKVRTEKMVCCHKTYQRRPRRVQWMP